MRENSLWNERYFKDVDMIGYLRNNTENEDIVCQRMLIGSAEAYLARRNEKKRNKKKTKK